MIPSGLETISMEAPNASIVRRFSMAKASDVTMCSGCSVTAQTNANELPVLPPVYSTTGLARCESAVAFGASDHRQRHPVLVRPGRIGRFHLHPHRGVVVGHQTLQPDQRCRADRRQRSLVHRHSLIAGVKVPGSGRDGSAQVVDDAVDLDQQGRVAEPLALQQLAVLDLAVAIERRAGTAGRGLDATGPAQPRPPPATA